MLAFLVLQQAAGAAAAPTPADSAFAREALRRGVAELAAGHWDLMGRYVAQLQAWGMVDEAWRLAMVVAQGPFDAGGSFHPAANLLTALYRAGDAEDARRRLDALPAGTRDHLAAMAAERLVGTHPELVETLLSEIRHPATRAKVHLARARREAARDSAAARAMLREAIEQLSGDTTRSAAFQRRELLIELRRMGDAVTVAELVEAAEAAFGDRMQARRQVVRLLNAEGNRAAAAPLLDTLFAMASRDTSWFGHNYRADLHELRGTAADSAAARALRDSADARLFAAGVTAPLTSRQRDHARHILINALRARPDSVAAAIPVVLSGGDAAKTLLEAAWAARDYLAVLSRGAGEQVGRPLPDSIRHRADSLYTQLWRATAGLTAEEADSARVALVQFLAELDAERALRTASDSIRVPRLRDRAIAAAVASLARTDADRAAREAEALRDSAARNVAYLELTERAVAGGRFALAADFADRTADGEARVRAQFVVATAELAAGREDAARARLARTLPLLDPFPRCAEHCVPGIDLGDGLRPRSGVLDAQAILDFVAVSLRMGLRDELMEWAAAQPTAARRAATWVLTAEALRVARPGRLVPYPAG